MLTYPEIDPVIFTIGPLAIRWYGLMYVAGFIAGWLGLRSAAKKPGCPVASSEIEDLVFYGAFGVFAGGRIGYMLLYNLGGLIDNPLSAAPGFILENVHVFAGVPSIMQAMFEGLRDSLPGGVAMTRLTVQCAIGEGTIASIMESVQAAHEGVSIGSYPWFKPGQFGTAAVVSGLDQQVTHAAAEALAAGVREMGADAEIMPLGEGG